jgi:tripartite-type tricarboxylate transporter receptor subunit TctC
MSLAADKLGATEPWSGSQSVEIKRITRILLSCLLTLTAFLQPAAAQLNSQRPITIVVPFGPGSGIDSGGRFIAESLGRVLNQPVVVENRPGAGGIVGATSVARADPDGHTLLLLDTSAVLQDWLHASVPYDVTTDFAPIAAVMTSPLMLFAQKSFAPNNVQELIALAKSEPGKLSAGTAGIGTPHHLALLMFNSLAKVEIVNVPYNSAGASVNDLLAGQIPMVWAGPTAVMQHVAAGTVKALGSASPQRLALFPEIPTVAEQGLPGFDVNIWFGIAAPAKTPPDVVAKLSLALAAVAADPAFQKRARAVGLDSLYLDSGKFGSEIKADHERFGKMIRDAGIKPQ